MSEEKFKGSDGIERTLSEWGDFTFARSALHNGDKPMDEALNCLHSLTLSALLHNQMNEKAETLNIMEATAKQAGEYFNMALTESMKNKGTMSGQYNELISHIEKMAKSLIPNKFVKKHACSQLGLLISEYITDYGALPTSRKALKEYADSKCVADDQKRIATRTIADYLPWYMLEDICRDNSRG